jgi:hypothetical protein
MVYDTESAPDYNMGSFTASTVPGCRAPHFWLEQDTSLYDALGAAYTLLCFKTECDAEVSAVQKAAGEANMPLKILDVSAYTDRPLEYSHHLQSSEPTRTRYGEAISCTQKMQSKSLPNFVAIQPPSI